jgi:predicted ArsR family transcriptional regulator
MDKKQTILNILKKEKKLSASTIANRIMANLDYAKRYLNELESEGKIKKEVKKNYTYYELK